MKTCLLSGSSQPSWHTSSTAAPRWGTVSLSWQPVQALPRPAPGCQLQVLLRLWANPS